MRPGWTLRDPVSCQSRSLRAVGRFAKVAAEGAAGGAADEQKTRTGSAPGVVPLTSRVAARSAVRSLHSGSS